jgi:succinyl-CoA synthetase alpha subunit
MAVLLKKDARVLAVGATGAYGSAQIRHMRESGTMIVAAAALGKRGELLDGLPLHDNVRDAAAAGAANTAIIYTPASGTIQSILDCADAGITLAVAAAELMPVRDTMYAIAYARERGMMVVGPNTAGMSSPGKAMLGAIPSHFTSEGRIGLFGRSGTLTMTMARYLTVRGIGQSTVVHIGGDIVVGGNPHEWLDLFLQDDETDAIVYLGEIGGTKEYAMLEAIAAASKPVLTMIVGRHAPPGKRMGHAGALIGSHQESAKSKMDALAEAGAIVRTSPAQIVEAVSQTCVRHTCAETSA